MVFGSVVIVYVVYFSLIVILCCDVMLFFFFIGLWGLGFFDEEFWVVELWVWRNGKEFILFMFMVKLEVFS